MSEVGRAALSRDLSDLLVELSIALHKHAMYPEGHPSLMPASMRVLQRLDPLVGPTGTLSLGVARDQLVIEGVATDPKNPVLADLAGRLHRHELGAVTFKQGVDPAQLHDVLSTLAVEADRLEQPLGRGPAEQLSRWSHITLYPVNYESLELSGGPGESGDEAEREARTQAAALWVGLARAALAMEQSDEAPASTEPSVVAEAIDRHPGTGAYDQVIVGYLLKIADELRTKKGTEALALKSRMSKLIQQLDDTTIKRLLHMGGDGVQRRQFLLNASEGMAVDAVIELVKAAGEAHEQNISHSLLRMLTKMSQHAESGSGERQKLADAAIREQVADLIKNWTLSDPNPDAYGQALQRMSAAAPMFAVTADAQYLPEPRRMFEMALEADVMGDAVERAVDQLVAEGCIRYVVDALDVADAPNVAEALWQKLGGGDSFREILSADPIDAKVMDKMVERLGTAAIEPMVDVLAESESQQTRRVLINRLVGFGAGVGPYVVRRLEDSRWFVQRNMLDILVQLPELPEGVDITGQLQSSEPRVRRKAVELALTVPTLRERAIAASLADEEDRIVRIGLAAAAESCPDTALPLVVRRAIDGTSDDQRLGAVRVLANSDNKAATEALIRMTAPRRSLFSWKLPPKSRAFVAALKALRDKRVDPRVRKILDVAARSRDPEVAAAAASSGEGEK